MALVGSGHFEDWLHKKLSELDIDGDVYGTYITGVLQEDDEDDKQSALSEILNSVMVSHLLCYL